MCTEKHQCPSTLWPLSSRRHRERELRPFPLNHRRDWPSRKQAAVVSMDDRTSTCLGENEKTHINIYIDANSPSKSCIASRFVCLEKRS